MSAAGFGLALWTGYDLLRIPPPDAAQIDARTELAMVAQVQAQPQLASDDAAMKLLRDDTRARIVREVDDAHRQDLMACAMGLAVGCVGIAQMVLLRRRV